MTQDVGTDSVPSKEEAIAHIFRIGQQALAARDLDRAREVFRDVLVLDPDNDLAKRALAAVDASEPIPPSWEIRLTRPAPSFLGESLPRDDAFVVSRLACGAMRLFRLLEEGGVVGRTAKDLLHAVERLRVRGAIAATP